MGQAVSSEQDQPVDETQNFLAYTSDAPVVPEAAKPENEPTAKTDDDKKPENEDEGKGKETAKPDEKPKELDSAEDDGDKKTGDSDKDDKKAGNDIPVGLKRAHDRLKRDRNTLREEVRALKGRIRELEGNSDAEVNPDDYDTHEDYQKAVKKSKADKEENDNKARFNEDLKEASETIFSEISEETERKIIEAGASLAFTPTVVLAIARCEAPGDITEYLAENPKKLSELASMSQQRMDRALMKLEMQLENGVASHDSGNQVTDDDVPPPPKKNSQAPEPIAPVAGNKSPEKKVEEMSFQEFESQRNASERQGKKFW